MHWAGHASLDLEYLGMKYGKILEIRDFWHLHGDVQFFFLMICIRLQAS